MRKFTTLSGLVAPLDRQNVDTDQIIPKQFLKRIERTGYEDGLFFDWRFEEDGSINRDFELNKARYEGASILLAQSNFGCGSSREHAPACMEIAGVQAVVAESYARIFYRKSIDGGVFIPLEAKQQLTEEIQTGDELTIDLENYTLTNDTQGKTYSLNSLGDVIDIIEAGDIFEYARKSGLIPS